MEVYIKEDDPFLAINLKDGELYTEYSNGLISYVDNNGPMEESYIPVSFSVKKSLFSPDERMYEEIEGINSILKELLYKVSKEKIKYIEVIEKSDVVIFNPLNEFDKYIYENSMYIKETKNQINIADFIGYTLFSAHPLTRIILEKWNSDKLYLLSDLKVKYVHDIAIIPLDVYNNENSVFAKSKFLEIIGLMDLEISNYVKNGYVIYNFSIFDLDNIDYVRNLCRLYNIEIVDESPSFLVLKNSQNIDFKTSLKEWIDYNLPIIKSGNFPVFSISGEWQNNWTNSDFQRINGTVFKRLFLKYSAIVAYSKLASHHPFIAPFIFLTDVNDDFSIRVSLPNINMVKELQKYISEEYSDSNLFYIESCDDFIDGIIKRKVLQKKDGESNSLLLKDEKGGEFLIFKSVFSTQMPPVFPRLFENVNKNKEEFRNELVLHFKNSKMCHDDLEPIKLEKVENLSFEELLFLIPVEENKISYCFTIDTLSKVNRNPITRSAFSPLSLMKMNYIEMGLRGFFDVNTLFGLLPDVPLKKNVSVDGIINMQRIKTEGEDRELLGNLFLIKVLFKRDNKNGEQSDLMEICLPTVGLDLIDETKFLVQELWKNGYFLDYFNSSIVLYSSNKNINFTLTDPLFLNAGMSIVDGNIALEKMRDEYKFL